MRATFLVLAALLAATPVVAETGHGEAPAPPVQGVSVDMPVLIAPMTVQGRLEGYAYLTVSLVMPSAGTIFEVRSKVPFLQDAFLRDVHKSSIVKAENPAEVDVEALRDRFIAHVNKIAVPGTVSDVVFQRTVVIPLKPE